MDEVAELQKLKVKGKGHLQASLLSPSDWAAPARSGWISKEGANRKSVKKRWFILQGSKMIYFKSNEVNSKSKPIGFFILEAGSKVALMPRDVKDKLPPFKWRVLTPSRTWEFTNETEEEMKSWVRVIARIVNPELTFGMPLSTIVARCKRRGNPSDIPGIVTTLIHFLRENDGLNVEGIFRMSGDQNSIKQLKSRFNTEIDTTIVIPKDTDVHVVTGTLKSFLRELETSVIPISSNALLRAILGLTGPKEKAIGFRKLIEGLPRENAATLQYILKYLSQIAQNHTVNLMTAQNLAIVFGPCFIRSEPNAVAFQDADMQLNSVNSMIELYQSIFPTEELIANASVPSSTATSTHVPPPASLPPSFNPPPPNRIPPGPNSFKPAGPGVNSRENAIVIGHASGTSSPTSAPGSGTVPLGQSPGANVSPPSYLPPLPQLSNSISLGTSASVGMPSPSTTAAANQTPEANGDDKRFGSRPPAFAPPSAPAGSSPSNTSSPLSTPDSIVGAQSDSSPGFVSIYDDSSSDEDVEEVVSQSIVEESSIVVTSLDDITDLEGEDGSIDVSKIFTKPINAFSPAKPRAGGVWTSVTKPQMADGTPGDATASPRNDSGLVLGSGHLSPSSSSISTNTTPNTAPASTSTSTSSSVSASCDDIASWLTSLGEDYTCYTATLLNEGFKTVKQLADINDDDMKELGIKMAHRKAMRAAIDKIKASP